MNRRIKAFLLQCAIKMQLHVARAFEFFKDEFVHAAAGFGQSGREHSQAASFFDVPGGAEKFLWFNERFRLDTA